MRSVVIKLKLSPGRIENMTSKHDYKDVRAMSLVSLVLCGCTVQCIITGMFPKLAGDTSSVQKAFYLCGDSCHGNRR